MVACNTTQHTYTNRELWLREQLLLVCLGHCVGLFLVLKTQPIGQSEIRNQRRASRLSHLILGQLVACIPTFLVASVLRVMFVHGETWSAKMLSKEQDHDNRDAQSKEPNDRLG
jgi:hypothetical protein